MPACRAGPGRADATVCQTEPTPWPPRGFACPAPSGYRLEEYEEAYQVLREGASPGAKVILDMRTL
jgi:hypothetical protein